MAPSQAVVFAATQPPPSPTPLPINGFSTAPLHLTPQEIALNNEKQQLANEYMTVLQGNVPLSVYEQHMIAYMNKYHLGNTANIHKVLTSSKAAKAQAVAQMTSSGVKPNNSNPTGSAQFPEEKGNWCGNAAVSTILVEDSFQWSGTNLNGNNVLRYNPYATSQSTLTATSDESMLAANYFGNSSNNNGVDPGPMNTVLNQFVNGNGGNYNPSSNTGNFQSDMVTDINQGWDLADGISIQPVGTYESRLFGYAYGTYISHWLPITYYGSGGATTYYADPVYKSPDYPTSNGWNVSGPYRPMTTTSLMQYTFVFIW